MKLPAFILAALLLPISGYAAENPANVPLTDVEQQLAAFNASIDKAVPALPTQKIEGFRVQETMLSERVEKVKAAGAVTAAEHASLLAAIEGQEKQLQAVLPKPRPVDSAAVPGGSVTGYVPGTYGSTTTIAPNGSVVMSNGPVVNGVPQGDTVVQPAFAQPTVK